MNLFICNLWQLSYFLNQLLRFNLSVIADGLKNLTTGSISWSVAMEIDLLLDVSHLVSMVIYFINLPFLNYTIFNLTRIFHRMISVRKLKLSWIPISFFLGLVLFWYMLNVIQNTPGRDIDPNMVKVCWCFSLVKPTFMVTCTSYIVAVSFIGGGNWSTLRKPLTCNKSLTKFIT
jgi:hypothetical protein